MKSLIFFLSLLPVCACNAQQNLYVLPSSIFVTTGTNTANLDFTPLYNRDKSIGDSVKALYPLITAATASANNAQSTANGAVQVNSNQSLQITGLQNQVAASQVNIAQNTADIQALQQSGGGTGQKAPQTITGVTYTITNADNLSTLLFTNKCTISFSSTITTPFYCRMEQQGSQCVFTGINIQSKFSWKKFQTQWGWITATGIATGIVSLDGDLKQ